MSIFRTIASLLICLSLFAGGMANAAMSCCIQKTTMEQVQLDSSKADMPCHKEASQKNTKNHNNCKKCWNCVGNTAIMHQDMQHTLTFSTLNHHDFVMKFISYNPVGIDSPPKHIS